MKFEVDGQDVKGRAFEADSPQVMARWFGGGEGDPCNFTKKLCGENLICKNGVCVEMDI